MPVHNGGTIRCRSENPHQIKPIEDTTTIRKPEEQRNNLMRILALAAALSVAAGSAFAAIDTAPRADGATVFDSPRIDPFTDEYNDSPRIDPFTDEFNDSPRIDPFTSEFYDSPVVDPWTPVGR